ncbi:MAG: type II secretion system protein GspM [Gemmatimonadota bacterium]
MTAREQRTLRWGAAAGALILGYVLVLDPYLLRSAERDVALEERESRLARYEALERSLPALRERQARARALWQDDVAPRLLAAQAPAVAASALSEEVRRIAAESLLEVEREDVLAAGQVGQLTSVPVQFSLRGDVYGLRDFLAALEAARIFLHVRELRVNATGDFGAGDAASAPLQITVTLEGYLRGEEAAGARAAPPPLDPADPDTPDPDGGAASRAGSAGAGLAPGVPSRGDSLRRERAAPPPAQTPSAPFGPDTAAGAR